MPQAHAMTHAVETSTLADVLERVLDKGVVIAGDIKIKLVDIELLSVQLRLVICSVEKAREMGMDWWVNNPAFCSRSEERSLQDSLSSIEQRLDRLESTTAPGTAGSGLPPCGQ
jgi:Gas vesicle protein